MLNQISSVEEFIYITVSIRCMCLTLEMLDLDAFNYFPLKFTFVEFFVKMRKNLLLFVRADDPICNATARTVGFIGPLIQLSRQHGIYRDVFT